MGDYSENLPASTPETQTAPRARAGGTGGQTDFSRSAQASLRRGGFRYRRPPWEDPPHEEAETEAREDLRPTSF